MKKIDIEHFEKTICCYSSQGYIYRGLSDAKYEPLPSICVGDKYGNFKFYENEMKCNKKIFDFGKKHKLSRAETLVLARHFGYKCRLVDYTYNPFIALYFACCNNDDIDGKIILFNLPKYIAEFINKEKNLTHYTNDEIFNLLEDNENNGVIGVSEYDEFGNQTELRFEYPLPLFCGFNETRPSIQHGLFLMWCDFGIDNNDVLKLLSKYTEILIIPSCQKEQLINHLKQKGYFENTILTEKSNFLQQSELNEFQKLISELNESIYE